MDGWVNPKYAELVQGYRKIQATLPPDAEPRQPGRWPSRLVRSFIMTSPDGWGGPDGTAALR